MRWFITALGCIGLIAAIGCGASCSNQQHLKKTEPHATNNAEWMNKESKRFVLFSPNSKLYMSPSDTSEFVETSKLTGIYMGLRWVGLKNGWMHMDTGGNTFNYGTRASTLDPYRLTFYAPVGSQARITTRMYTHTDDDGLQRIVSAGVAVDPISNHILLETSHSQSETEPHIKVIGPIPTEYTGDSFEPVAREKITKWEHICDADNGLIKNGQCSTKESRTQRGDSTAIYRQRQDDKGLIGLTHVQSWLYAERRILAKTRYSFLHTSLLAILGTTGDSKDGKENKPQQSLLSKDAPVYSLAGVRIGYVEWSHNLFDLQLEKRGERRCTGLPYSLPAKYFEKNNVFRVADHNRPATLEDYPIVLCFDSNSLTPVAGK